MGVQIKQSRPSHTWWDKTQLYLNAVNHILIGIVAFYTIWLCFNSPASIYITHIWTCTLAYNVLMCESMMALYNRNSWSNMHERRTKRNLHWILQAIGCTLAFVGMFTLYLERGFSIRSIHSQTGFASNILIVFGVINGSSSLWAAELRRFVKPVYTKLFHNLTGAACFVCGMVALIYGFQKRSFARNSTPETVLALQCICGLTILLSTIGAMKSMWSQCLGTFEALKQLTKREDDEKV